VKLLVTGAAGFIGSTHVRQVCDERDVVVLDKLTYNAGGPDEAENIHNRSWWKPIRCGDYRDYYRRQYCRHLSDASTLSAA
jgi:nucleoside-diphosphate-sugar epimerase